MHLIRPASCSHIYCCVLCSADLWTEGIDAVEYSLFLRQLFSNITEGQPPDKFFWLPTEAIVHGGYTSPRKVRPDEPSADGRDSPAEAQVDVLHIDNAGNTFESHDSLSEPLQGKSKLPQSPLRGGRHGGFATDESDGFADALSRLARTSRPKSSPSLRERARLQTAPGRAGGVDHRQDERVAKVATALMQSQVSPRTREEMALQEARWHGSMWHRPLTASRIPRPVGVRPCTAGTGTSDAVSTSFQGLPTAGLAADGLVGGVATERMQQDQGAAVIFEGMPVGSGRRPSTGAPPSAAPWLAAAAAAAAATTSVSALAPIQMRSALPQPTSLIQRQYMKATSKPLELAIDSSAERHSRRPSTSCVQQSSDQTPLLQPTPPPKPFTSSRRPLANLESNKGIAAQGKRHVVARRFMSEQFNHALRAPKAPGMGARVVSLAGKHAGGVASRSPAPIRRVTGVPVPELPQINDGRRPATAR